MKKSTKRYEAPCVEVIEIKPQGMLCASCDASAANAGGGITDMGYSSGFGWSAGAGGGTADMGYGSGYGW